MQADGTIRIFDNSTPRLRERSRVIWLALDAQRRTATLARELAHPDDVQAGTQGNAQVEANGNVLVGWGSQGRITEHAPDGGVLLDLNLPRLWDTYRAFRAPWVGLPPTRPSVAARGSTAYASWNGATEVASWQVIVGGVVVATAPRSGFETAIRLASRPAGVTVRALDARGGILGTSRTVAPD
jgi:hypothetical protein